MLKSKSCQVKTVQKLKKLYAVICLKCVKTEFRLLHSTFTTVDITKTLLQCATNG